MSIDYANEKLYIGNGVLSQYDLTANLLWSSYRGSVTNSASHLRIHGILILGKVMLILLVKPAFIMLDALEVEERR